jgi:hypothetical protein
MKLSNLKENANYILTKVQNHKNADPLLMLMADLQICYLSFLDLFCSSATTLTPPKPFNSRFDKDLILRSYANPFVAQHLNSSFTKCGWRFVSDESIRTHIIWCELEYEDLIG